MEIKVIGLDKGAYTSLLESSVIHYRFIYYNGNEDFVEKYNKETSSSDINTTVYTIGIPDGLWETLDNSNDNSERFLSVFVNKDDVKGQQKSILIIKNAKVYITCNGNTIDVIEV